VIISLPISIINKNIRRNNLIHKKSRYSPKRVSCPSFAITRSNYLNKLDVIGPKYLKEDRRSIRSISLMSMTAGIVLTLSVDKKDGYYQGFNMFPSRLRAIPLSADG